MKQRGRRIERALRELPLAETDIAAAAAELLDTALVLYRDRPLPPYSRFFDFRARVAATVRHFAAHGLTLEQYLHSGRRKTTTLHPGPRHSHSPY